METHIHPKEVADKSKKESLQEAIKMSLAVESDAVRHNTQNFNNNRYKSIKDLSDYESLKKTARQIKENAIKILPELVEKLTSVLENRGGRVYYAKTKQEANDCIKNICELYNAKLVVKAKSITSEEIGLNEVLEKAGIEVAETDLAEFILQRSHEQPSHIVAPAIHQSRERISKLFKEHFNTDLPLQTGEDLTEFARLILRQKFLSADIGISGANLISSDGAILLVESEGNIRLTTHLPSVHIVIAGIEKIIQSKKDFGTFIELLARSATGQPLTSYTNILEPPIKAPVLNLNGRSDTQREFYLILVDNGRMAAREDNELKEALNCIRCSACMNVCANFQAVGGHAFGGECYTGGIGGAWTFITTNNLEKAKFAELCTGCSRCVPNCPVQIDIPALNTEIKNRLIKNSNVSLQKNFFGNFAITSKIASVSPNITNWIANLPVSRTIMETSIGFDKRRSIPPYADKTLVKQFKRYTYSHTENKSDNTLIILFADVYTNYNNPHVGMSAVKVYNKLGLPVGITKVLAEGRASLSQGLVQLARKRSIRVAGYLEELIRTGKEIIVAEPSVLALFRSDYKKLISNDGQFYNLARHTFDPVEYLNILLNRKELDLEKYFDKTLIAGTTIFYHEHCQMRTIGAGDPQVEFFKRLGFKIIRSTAECCGMAGSFGYKKDYYELSKNVGNDLIKQIIKTKTDEENLVILASGTSCREQIFDEIKLPIYHPIEFLEKLLF